MSYEDALALFAALGRLVHFDETGAIITSISDQEGQFCSPATVIASAAMIVKNDPDARALYETEVVTGTTEEPEHTPQVMNAGASLNGAESHRLAGLISDPVILEPDADRPALPQDVPTFCICGQRLDHWDLCPVCDLEESAELIDGSPESHAVCEEHAGQLAGWEEEWCPLCEVEASTASGEASISEPTIGGGQMNRNTHFCTMTGRFTFAGHDGLCKHCRPREVAGTVVAEANGNGLTAEEAVAPSIESIIIEETGSLEAFLEGVQEIIQARLSGHAGTHVANRVTRKVLEAIQHDELLVEEYRQYLEPFNITVNGPDNGLYYHDYTHYQPGRRPTQLPMVDILSQVDAPEVEQLTGVALRESTWMRAQRERRQARERQREIVRATRRIELCWVANEGGHAGAKILGQNTPQTRELAAQLQQAGKERGFNVTFRLV